MAPDASKHTTRAEIGYEPDGKWHDVWVEVKFQTHGFRNLRASLLGLAYWLTTDPGSRGVLILVDSRITEERLQKERRLAEQVFNSDVMRRLTVAIARDKHYFGLPQDLGDDFRAWVNQLVLKESHEGRPRESFYAILQILLNQWLLAEGPMTTEWLMKAAGCSYPTVAAALRRLDSSLRRHSDRRIELRYFPREEWARLLAVSEEVRTTTRFADRSGQPCAPESLLRRLEQLKRTDIAVGGVLGARHYYRDLDVIGTPRLDLSVHWRGKNLDWGFVKQLDPALQETKRRDEPAPLVVHIVHRASSLFQPGGDGLQWADPIECLLVWEDANYCWIVLCKNNWYHLMHNLLSKHHIPLGFADAYMTVPPLDGPFSVKCDVCGAVYSYEPSDVMGVERDLPQSFTPHPLFR